MKIGQVQLSKGGKYYLKVGAGVKPGTEQGITLKVGDVLFLEKPSDMYKRLVELGKLDAATAESRIANIPPFVRYNVEVSPDQFIASGNGSAEGGE